MSERRKIPLSKALKMLKIVKNSVHTFRQVGPILIGADWTLGQVKSAVTKHGIELSGVSATAMGHGLVLIDTKGPLFLETKAVRPTAEETS